MRHKPLLPPSFVLLWLFPTSYYQFSCPRYRFRPIALRQGTLFQSWIISRWRGVILLSNSAAGSHWHLRTPRNRSLCNSTRKLLEISCSVTIFNGYRVYLLLLLPLSSAIEVCVNFCDPFREDVRNTLFFSEISASTADSA